MLKIETGRFMTAAFVAASGFLGCASRAPESVILPENVTPTPISTPLSTPTQEPTIAIATAEPTKAPSPQSTIEVLMIESPKENWMYSRPIWQDYRWFPIGPDKARREGLTTLEESLGKYDKLAKLLLGIDSRFQDQYKAFASSYIAKFPQTLDWAGFCHGLAHAEVLDPQPLTAPETFTLPRGEGVTITYEDRLAFGVALHSGDAMLRRDKSLQKNLDILIDELIKTGQPFVVEAPAPGLPGLWYRGVGGVSRDRSKLMVTSFKRNGGLESLDRVLVRDAYIPILSAEIATSGADPKLLELAPNDWNIPLNKPFVNRLNYRR